MSPTMMPLTRIKLIRTPSSECNPPIGGVFDRLMVAGTSLS